MLRVRAYGFWVLPFRRSHLPRLLVFSIPLGFGERPSKKAKKALSAPNRPFLRATLAFRFRLSAFGFRLARLAQFASVSSGCMTMKNITSAQTSCFTESATIAANVASCRKKPRATRMTRARLCGTTGPVAIFGSVGGGSKKQDGEVFCSLQTGGWGSSLGLRAVLGARDFVRVKPSGSKRSLSPCSGAF